MVVLKNCGPEISYILAKLFGIGLKNLIFQIAGRSHLWSLYLRMLGETSVAKNYCPVVSRLSAVSKVFEKLVNNRIADHLKKCFLLSNMVLGLLDHLQTFWQLYLTELLGLLTDLGLLKQWHAGFLHRLKSYEIQFRYLTLFRLFSVIDGFECFRMEIRHKNIQLMLEFLKAPFLVLNIPTIT